MFKEDIKLTILDFPKDRERLIEISKDIMKNGGNRGLIFASINMLIFATMGIIIQWSPLWLVKDLYAPLYMVGSIVILFNIGEIISNWVFDRSIFFSFPYCLY